MTVIKACYMCDKCLESPEYDLDYDGGDFLCPKCGYKMVYWETCEIDTETNKVVNRWVEPIRKMNNPYISSGTSVKMNPVVTCPYCNSTNTKKISLTAKAMNTALFGILGTKRHKQWHCNKCGSEW